MDKQDLLNQSADFWNSLVNEFDKGNNHPDDMRDIRFHIHAIQNIIYTKMYKELPVSTVKNPSIDIIGAIPL